MSARLSELARGLDWLRRRDSGLTALRRAGRSAIVMPAMFAIGDKVIANPAVATFAAFGAFSMLLLVDFGGTMRERVAAQVSLIAVGTALVCLGTLASRWVWLAATGMLLVGFAVLFSGVVSSVLAGASTSTLLAFILPVTLPGSVSAIPDRVEGWLLAGAASLLAITLLWPAPAREPLRHPAAEACRLVAQRLRTDVGFMAGEIDAADRAAAALAATDAVAALRSAFFATPYRPTGLTTAARTLVRLVDELVWLDSILNDTPGPHPHSVDPSILAVKRAAADALEHGADRLDDPRGDVTTLTNDLQDLGEALDAMEQAVTTTLPVHPTAGTGDEPVTEFVSSLEPSFRVQEMSFAVSAIGTNIDIATAAQRRTWLQQVLGRRSEGDDGTISSVQQRARAHVERHSVWLHNSVRGAIALAIAVAIADLTGVQHSFWVVLGTLSVLRSNALSTGQNALRGLTGTAVGFVVGGLLVLAIGTNTTVLWVLLPLAILFAGLAPAVISFAAGQAGFTITLLILFNIIAPSGWQVGLVRVEDVAIGCAVSLAVGALFWPRGAAFALGQALAEAYSDSAGFLRSAVAFGVARCDSTAAAGPVPDDAGDRAAAAARRLDDAFRGFLAERGTKHLPLAQVATLITGVAGLRLTASAILELWRREDGTPAGDRAPARAELLAAAHAVAGWYEASAVAIAGAGDVADVLPHDQSADARLIEAVRRDLTGGDGLGTATAVRMIWTGDHLDAARRLQQTIIEPARAVAARQRELPLVPRPKRRFTHLTATALATSD